MALLSLVAVTLGVIKYFSSLRFRQYNEGFQQKSNRFELLTEMVSKIVLRVHHKVRE